MHYLAMLGTTLDDVPLRLFPTREAAQQFIDEHPPEVPDRIMDLIRRDRAEPCCFYIATFSDDGEPIAFDVVRNLDDEEAPAESC